MTDRMAYRQRVATVRGRARAQLAAIRKERLARMRMGPEAADPLAAAWVADQLADAGGWTDAPARTPTLALVAPAPAEDTEAAAAIADSPPENALAQPEKEEPNLPADAADPEEPAACPGEAAACRDPADEMTAPPDDPPGLAKVDASGPREPETPPDTVVAEAHPHDSGDPGTPPDVAAAATDTPDPAPREDEPMVQAYHGAPAPDGPLDALPPEPLWTTDDAPDAVIEPPPSETPIPRETTDLSEIPGIGPGLIWMLREAGVGTLDDLVRADAPDLARKLGTIARLLDLDYFIDFARARSQAR